MSYYSIVAVQALREKLHKAFR